MQQYLDLVKHIMQEIEQTYPQVTFMIIADKAPTLGLKRMKFEK